MPKIFISYRHTDCPEVAGRIYDWLVQKFGSANVFMDVNNMEPGAVFPDQLHVEIASADVALVIIGPTWLLTMDKETGQRRLDDPEDWVRREVELAVASRAQVIPVLVLDATLPKVSALPASLRDLVLHHAIEVRPAPHFRNDMTQLLAVLDRLEPRRKATSYVLSLALLAVFSALAYGAWSAKDHWLPPAQRQALGKQKQDFDNPAGPPLMLDCTQDAVEPDAAAQAAQEAWALYLQEPQVKKMVPLDPTTSMEFALIPPGVFRMGEENKKTKTINYCFYIGTHEVTRRQWRALMGENPELKEDDLPIESVSWYQCKAFCDKLTQRLAGPIARLPREDEWEYSCRAGRITSYSFGADTASLKDHAWFQDNSDDVAHPVGILNKPNAWGLHDMHGNVGEWCKDPWDNVGTLRVIRGGSYRSKAENCRAAHRNKGEPTKGHPAIGFRVVIPLKVIDQ